MNTRVTPASKPLLNPAPPGSAGGTVVWGWMDAVASLPAMSREGLLSLCLLAVCLSCSTEAVPQRAQPEPGCLCLAPGAGILFIHVATLGEQLCRA